MGSGSATVVGGVGAGVGEGGGLDCVVSDSCVSGESSLDGAVSALAVEASSPSLSAGEGDGASSGTLRLGWMAGFISAGKGVCYYKHLSEEKETPHVHQSPYLIVRLAQLLDDAFGPPHTSLTVLVPVRRIERALRRQLDPRVAATAPDELRVRDLAQRVRAQLVLARFLCGGRSARQPV